MQLTRQQKRQNERENKKLNHLIHDIDLIHPTLMKAIKETMEKETRNVTAGMMIALFACTLNADYGFGKKRLNRLISDSMGQFAGIHNGSLPPKQIIDWCNKKGIAYTKHFRGDLNNETYASESF